VILPDGSRQKVAIDFAVLRDISAACRKKGLAGTVQHGASTLPEDLFTEFPRNEAIEIHLATELQRIVFGHPRFPADLREKIHRWVRETRPPEWKDGATEAQNLEKCLKRSWGPHKKDVWNMPQDDLRAIMQTLEDKFRRYFTLLKVAGTRGVVDRHVKPVAVVPPKPAGL
jgi:hypothetical protein